MLPIYQSESKEMSLMQSAWASQLNPVLKQALVSGLVLASVQLSTGANVVDHKLGRKLQGWFLVRQRGPASIYDTQDSNTMPQLTLLINSSSNVLVDIYVF